jgi:hypothetical protein
LSDGLGWLEKSESEKRIKGWRQSEPKAMIETIQELIQTSHKYSKSQYTPRAERSKWIKLAGQLIWYKDQILKNTSLEAMEIEMTRLKERVVEGEKWRKRQSVTLRYPKIVFRKPGVKEPGDVEKEKNGESSEGAEDSETVEAESPEGAKEIA